MSELDEAFSRFYRAVNGHDPYRWQLRLVSSVVEQRRWPDRLDGPTGSGKSVVVDAHVFLNAFAGYYGIPTNVPRRLVIAVNRRSLVDSQYQHAANLAGLLAGLADRNDCEDQKILVAAHNGLRKRWGAAGAGYDYPSPLVVASIRGGIDARHHDTSWRMYPDAPAVICATPDMVGSRLLFRGYGTSRGMRPVEAGLLAYDTVLVVDEAHLNRQLVKTARDVKRLERLAQSAEAELGVPSLQVVESTATPPSSSDDDITNVSVVEEDIEKEPQLARRVASPKVVSYEKKGVDYKKLPTYIARRAGELARARGGATAVIVNTVTCAANVAEELSKTYGEQSVVCILGKMRPYDRRRALEGLWNLEEQSEGVSFIVGTQALEVGLDYDCASMVTELAPIPALKQRLGRLNRFGKREDGRAVVIDCKASLKLCDFYNNDDLKAARNWIGDGFTVTSYDLSHDSSSSQMLRRQILQRLEMGDVEWFSHTSEHLGAEEGTQASFGDKADLGLWLRDDLPTQDEREGFVVVRGDLPVDEVSAVDLLARIPPVEDEMFPASMRVLVQIRDASYDTDLTQSFRVFSSEDGQLFHRMQSDETIVPGGVYVVDSPAPVFFQHIVRPHPDGEDTLGRDEKDIYNDIVFASLGVDSPRAASPYVLDKAAFQVLACRDGLAEEAANRFWEDLSQAVRAWVSDSEGEETLSHITHDLIHQFGGIPLDGYISGALDNLDVLPVHDDGAEDSTSIILISQPRIVAADFTQVELGCSDEISLEQHIDDVVAQVGSITTAVRLQADYSQALKVAAAHHDDGKRDQRFQTMLGGGRRPNTLMAKGRAQSRAEVIRLYRMLGIHGWRHEQLSVVLAWAAIQDDPMPMLEARLIGTSHGRGRDTFDSGTVGLASDGLLGSTEMELADSLYSTGMWELLIDRTNKTYGYWGCAYLEAILRAADWRASAGEQR